MGDPESYPDDICIANKEREEQGKERSSLPTLHLLVQEDNASGVAGARRRVIAPFTPRPPTRPQKQTDTQTPSFSPRLFHLPPRVICQPVFRPGLLLPEGQLKGGNGGLTEACHFMLSHPGDF